MSRTHQSATCLLLFRTPSPAERASPSEQELAASYETAVVEEDRLSAEALAIANVGRRDAKKHLEEHVHALLASNIVQTLGTMLDTVVF